jgi:diaminohydroxyphosphoribosylaminopyrimidine deaminase/5-amino-6-(5-phosphoribosylamino)uracil reductase
VPINANIFSRDRKVIIVTVASLPGQETENRKTLEQKAKILEVKEKAGQINIRDMLKKLAQLEITNILVEGGGTLIGTLFDEALVDKVMFFISPKIIGGKDAIGSVMGKGISRLDSAVKLKNVQLRRLGEDFLIEGYVK